MGFSRNEQSKLQIPKCPPASTRKPGRGPRRPRGDSPFVQLHHRPLCRQGGHLDPVGTRASSFCLLMAPELLTSALHPQALPEAPSPSGRWARWARWAQAGPRPVTTTTRTPSGRAPCPKESSQKTPERKSGGWPRQGQGCGGEGLGGPEHLPQGQALRGDRDLRENRQGPGRDENGHIRPSVPEPLPLHRLPLTPPHPAPATPSVLTPGGRRLIAATPPPAGQAQRPTFWAHGRQAPRPHFCSQSSRPRQSPDLQASRMFHAQNPLRRQSQGRPWEGASPQTAVRAA